MALDLRAFFQQAVRHGVGQLRCSGGSVFLFDGATGALQLQTMTYADRSPVPLGRGQGVAGDCLERRCWHCYTGEDLARTFVNWDSHGRLGIRAIAAIPVYHHDTPQAVFCFDFDGGLPRESRDGLSAGEYALCEELAADISSAEFANAVWRARVHQAQLDILSAGEGPARLRHSVADYLTDVLDGFRKAGGPVPDLAYLQLVDWRRGTIRTIQGVGLPLSFETSHSHTLESNDVQAYVVRNGCPILIVGQDPLLDTRVFRQWHHERFVRLWIPLLPFRLPVLACRSCEDFEQVVTRALIWGDPESHGNGSLRREARWAHEVVPTPPSRLIYGTLEIGFRRRDLRSPAFEPLSAELANWTVAHAYALSERIFSSSLAGSLDAVAKAAACLMWPSETQLTVAMPDWRTPEVRRYPTASRWLTAIPEIADRQSPSPGAPAMLEVSPPAGREHVLDELLRDTVASAAQQSVRVALHLDDHAAELYTLVERAEEERFVGTSFPDPRLSEILQEMCRESAAKRCTHFLFGLETTSGPDSQLRTLRLLGVPQHWPHDVPEEEGELALAQSVADSGCPAYQFIDAAGVEHQAAALPMDLAEDAKAVVVFHFFPGATLSEGEQHDLEGRVARWVYRLSLWHLVIAERFGRLMSSLRVATSQVRRQATETPADGRSLSSFCTSLLPRISEAVDARAAVLTLFHDPATGPLTVDRFWLGRRTDDSPPVVDGGRFVGSPQDTPGWRAVQTRDLVIYGPADSTRRSVTQPVDMELLARAQQFENERLDDRAALLTSIVALVRGEAGGTTMVVVPLGSPVGLESSMQGALTVLLPGVHDLSQAQRQQILELGHILAEAVGQLRAKDAAAYGQRLSERLERRRARLAEASTHDECMGQLLQAIARSAPNQTIGSRDESDRWDLCEHAVVWLLGPGNRELVARSGRGRGLEVLGASTVIELSHHPLLARELQPDTVPRKSLPRLKAFRAWTLKLSDESRSAICRAYGAIQGSDWLLSFPLMNAANQLLGVVDCVRETPPPPEEESTLTGALRRLSIEVCAAFVHCRFEQAIEVARELTEDANAKLEAFHAHEAYFSLVKRVRDDLGVQHCDLFLDRDGSMLLYATTRREQPLPESERRIRSVTAAEGEEVLGAALAAKTPKLAHAASARPDSLVHLSPPLLEMLSDDHMHERLAIPLGTKSGRPGPVPGLLYVRGPLSTLQQGKDPRPVKKSGLATREFWERSIDLAVVIHRIAMAATLVERQAWLVDGLQHTLGQPLQRLRTSSQFLLRAFHEGGAPADSVTLFKRDQDRAFDFVHEVRNHLAIYAKMTQQPEASQLGPVNLTSLVRRCCEFMKPEAATRECHIGFELAHLRPITAHRPLLRAAIINLLDNAIKYSYRNREIDVELIEDVNGRITLTVSDYGVGIPEPDLPRVFEPYFRSRVPDPKGERPGTGIGLAIVRHAIEAVHSGVVTATSTPPRDIAAGLSAEETARFPHKTVFTVTLQRGLLHGSLTRPVETTAQ